MSELRSLLSDTTERVLKDLPADFDAAWERIRNSGLTLTMVEEDAGGFGGTWQDACVVIRATGYHATSLPIAESLLACHLVSEASDPYSICVQAKGVLDSRRGSRVFTGRLHDVPYGRHVRGVVTRVNTGGYDEFVFVDCRNPASVETRENLAGEPRDTMVLEAAPADSPLSRTVDLYSMLALIRAAQIAGAMEAALSLSVEYTRQRQQFGKPLASFQAIQQQLAVLAEETAAAGMAAASAFRALDRGDASFEIAAAKLRANRAVTLGAPIAHQVHGAMGFTAEYRLQHLTRRLWAWQNEFGNERFWADRIGAGVAARGPENFWADLVAVSDRT
jgi:acyl-CoA dehydrogenase